MEIIGLSGWAGAGKDTLADFLVANHGWTRAAFADPLRAAALAIDPIIGLAGEPDEHAVLVHYAAALEEHGYTATKEMYPDARRFLQRLGTEFGRALVGDTFWVNMAFAALAPNANLVVFTDVRFKNEARAIKERGGLVVRIERPGHGPANDHISEHDLDDWPFDHTIQNSAAHRDLAIFASYLNTQAELERVA